VVHCTYLVRADIVPQITYDDGSGRHEYVIFADSARKAGIPQYIDNRQIYGYITFGEGDDHHVSGGIDEARALLGAAGGSPAFSGASKVHAIPRHAPLMPINVINLDRSADRWRTFKTRNAHLRDVIRFSAFDGRGLDRQTLIDDGVILDDCDYTPGALGCALSHITLWKAAVTQGVRLTVFEDDVVVAHRFEENAGKLATSIRDGWDFIQWGYVFDPLFAWADFGTAKAKLQFYDFRFSGPQKLLFQSANLTPSAVRLVHSFGTQGYSVSPRGAQILLKHCVPLRKRLIAFPNTSIVNTDTGIDVAMCAAYAEMRAFMCLPPMVIHDDEQSSDRSAA
jgi:GR25 family glycosyltransferase involved in LPS biosynthesis